MKNRIWNVFVFLVCISLGVRIWVSSAHHDWVQAIFWLIVVIWLTSLYIVVSLGSAYKKITNKTLDVWKQYKGNKNNTDGSAGLEDD